MTNGLIGRKLGMTRVFQEDGTAVPVTVIEAGPCRVVQVRDGGVQLGFGARRKSRATKAELGHAKKAGLDVAPQVLRTFAAANGEGLAPGAEVKVDIFAAGELVKVTGTTKGRGFQGVVHRHGFGGGPATHGNTRHRKPGSISPGTDLSRVIKGKRMPATWARRAIPSWASPWSRWMPSGICCSSGGPSRAPGTELSPWPSREARAVMIEAPHYSPAGARRDAAFALPADPFDGTVNEPVLHQAVKVFLNNQRQGTAKTKTRSFVSGGNQKPWKQKGTGRARQGSTRAPHWRHGGIVFGPKPRDYTLDMPKRMRRLALRSALSAKMRDGQIVIIDSFADLEGRTKEAIAFLGRLGEARGTVIATREKLENVSRGANNIPEVKAMLVNYLNLHDLLKHARLILDRDAVAYI